MLWSLKICSKFTRCLYSQCVFSLVNVNVLQNHTGGRGFRSEHAHQVDVQLGRVVFPEVTRPRLLAVLVLLPGGDPVLSLDVPQRVVVGTDVVRTAKHLSDDHALLRQRHKAVSEGHHLHNRGVNVLNVEEVSWEERETQKITTTFNNVWILEHIKILEYA